MSEDPEREIAFYRDKRTGFRFDPHAGTYELGGSTEYEKPGMGYSVRYKGPGNEHIDIYLYDLDLPDIPEGVDGPVVMSGFADALGVFDEFVKRGDYVDYELLETSFITIQRPHGPGPEFLHAAVTYDCTPREGMREPGPRNSHLFFRGFRGKFLKVRFTYMREAAAGTQERFDAFLAWLGEQFDLPN